MANTASKVATIGVGGVISITLASTVLSKKANTSAVINSGGSAVSNTLASAEGSTK